MKHPLISVIVPVYNVEQYLEECVLSLINQTYGNLEIILVDDGSQDNSGNMCDEFAIEDKRVKVIHKENGGLSDARNVGLDIAKGDYIAFVDSDDWVNERIYEVLIRLVFESDSDIGECKFINVYNRENTREDKIKRNDNKYFTNEEAIFNHLNGKYLYRCVWNKLYRRELFQDIRFPKGRVAEDLYVTYKLFYKAKQIAYTEFIGYYYYIRPNSIMGKGGLDLIISMFEGLREQHNFIISKLPSHKKRMDKLYMNCLLKTYGHLALEESEEGKKYKNIVINELKRKDIKVCGISKILLYMYSFFPNMFIRLINILEKRKR